MVQKASLAVIPACLAVRAPIGDMQLPAAMSAAQETGQQRLATAHRSTRHETLAVGVVGDQALIPLELRPREISFVMVREQDVPFGSFALVAADNALAACLDRHPTAGSAEQAPA